MADTERLDRLYMAWSARPHAKDRFMEAAETAKTDSEKLDLLIDIAKHLMTWDVEDRDGFIYLWERINRLDARIMELEEKLDNK